MTEDEKLTIFKEVFQDKKIVNVDFYNEDMNDLTLDLLNICINSDWCLLRFYVDRNTLKEHLISIGFKLDMGLTFSLNDIYITFNQRIEYIELLEYGQQKNFESAYVDGLLRKKCFFKNIRPNLRMSSANYVYSKDGCLETITYYYNDNRNTKGSNLSLFAIIEKPYDVVDKINNTTLACSFFDVVYIDINNGNHYELSKLIKYFDGKEKLHLLNDKSDYYDLKNLFSKKEIELLNMMHI
jgi:hypothetical protein